MPTAKKLHSGQKQKILLIDPAVKTAMAKRKLPFETWNSFFTRVCDITYDELNMKPGQNYYGVKTKTETEKPF